MHVHSMWAIVNVYLLMNDFFNIQIIYEYIYCVKSVVITQVFPLLLNHLNVIDCIISLILKT